MCFPFGALWGAGKQDKQLRAVKLLRRGAAEEDYADFVSESEAMLALEHENVVNLLGVAIQERPWLLVLEYCEHGDLRRLLRACRHKEIELKLIEKYTFADQICAAMEYSKSQMIASLPFFKIVPKNLDYVFCAQAPKVLGAKHVSNPE